MKTKRIGVFYVSGEFFRDLEAGQGVNLFDQMVVLRAEQCWERDAVRYMAVHPDFEPRIEGQQLPEYTGTFTADSSVPKWVRV